MVNPFENPLKNNFRGKIIKNPDLGALESMYSFTMFARSAITLGSAKSEMFVRSSSSSFVRKIIHFCEREIGGGHIDVLTGSLTQRFFGVRKKTLAYLL